MPLTFQKLIPLLPQGLADLALVEAAIAGLPPAATRKFVDYAVALGCSPGSAGYALAATADSVKAVAATP